MAAKKWNGKRTLDHCGLITKCVKAGIGRPEQRGGMCNGYQRSETDDEPCVTCKQCKLNEFWEE